MGVRSDQKFKISHHLLLVVQNLYLEFSGHWEKFLSKQCMPMGYKTTLRHFSSTISYFVIPRAIMPQMSCFLVVGHTAAQGNESLVQTTAEEDILSFYTACVIFIA